MAAITEKERAMSEEITVTNYRKSRKFGWGWSTTPTGEDAYSIETPSAPDYEGTLSQLRKAMAADKAFQTNLGSVFYNTAWFYDGRRITHTWQFSIIAEPENADDLLINEYYDACEYGYTWSAGWAPDWDAEDVKIKVK